MEAQKDRATCTRSYSYNEATANYDPLHPQGSGLPFWASLGGLLWPWIPACVLCLLDLLPRVARCLVQDSGVSLSMRPPRYREVLNKQVVFSEQGWLFLHEALMSKCLFVKAERSSPFSVACWCLSVRISKGKPDFDIQYCYGLNCFPPNSYVGFLHPPLPDCIP